MNEEARDKICVVCGKRKPLMSHLMLPMDPGCQIRVEKVVATREAVTSSPCMECFQESLKKWGWKE